MGRLRDTNQKHLQYHYCKSVPEQNGRRRSSRWQEGTPQVQAEDHPHLQEQGPQAWPEGIRGWYPWHGGSWHRHHSGLPMGSLRWHGAQRPGEIWNCVDPSLCLYPCLCQYFPFICSSFHRGTWKTLSILLWVPEWGIFGDMIRRERPCSIQGRLRVLSCPMPSLFLIPTTCSLGFVPHRPFFPSSPRFSHFDT